jgi:hypothetical protein
MRIADPPDTGPARMRRPRREGGGGAVTSEFGWVLIRQDESGSRYRVGRYATRAEAERVADALARPAASTPPQWVYLIEQVVPRAAQT